MEPSILESIGSVEFIFDGSRHIVDGGGHGTRLRLLLEKYPHARETLFEKAKVLAMRPPVPSTIADRLEAVDGDFFKSVSAGADTYILQQVIHVWDDDSSLRILKSCKAAMGTDGKIVINDTVIPPGNEPNFNKLTDLHMMVLTHGGKERTETEFRDLVARAGLSLRRVVPTSTAFSLLEVGNRV